VQDAVGQPPNTQPEGVQTRPLRSLLVAVLLVFCESTAVLGLGLGELLSLHAERLVLGLTTAAFYLAYGAALAACAVGLLRGRRWSRAPLVLTQLIALGVASSFAGGSTLWVGLVLAAVALVVLVVLLLPATTALIGGD